ncbi:MAG: prepilin-type N-terminal cleavage/methylation domain-containing protein [Gammaproteobacteria bacterium]|nr:prepilin-type N-terminal cleavage/methylation domain-containing protein [Gammaproteobacteria bacterium]
MTGKQLRGRRPDGFTLIELLVVISIIATLLTIAAPRYFKSLERSKETVLRQDLSILRDAIDKYRGDLDQYPESLQTLVDNGYIRAVPKDPITNSAETWIVVPSDDADKPGVKDVHSGAEGAGLSGLPFVEL